MGGYGSGSWQSLGARRTTSEYLRLDVRALNRKGLLEPGAKGTTTWSNGSSIAYQAGQPDEETGRSRELVLSYEQAGEPVLLGVDIDWTPCNYGGARPWLLCPRCFTRVAVLHGAPFYCRHCQALTYQSTREDAAHRGLRKAQRIRLQLGGSADLQQPVPFKPKGMHWRTYERLLEEEREAHRVWLLGLVEGLKRMTRQLSKR